MKDREQADALDHCESCGLVGQWESVCPRCSHGAEEVGEQGFNVIQLAIVQQMTGRGRVPYAHHRLAAVHGFSRFGEPGASREGFHLTREGANLFYSLDLETAEAAAMFAEETEEQDCDTYVHRTINGFEIHRKSAWQLICSNYQKAGWFHYCASPEYCRTPCEECLDDENIGNEGHE